MCDIYDLILVGGGPAGLTAALYAKRAGLNTLLLEGSALGGQAAVTPEIENWPATAHISGSEFSTALYEQTAALGAEIRFETAVGVQDQGTVKQIFTSQHTYRTRTVILANGVRRRKLGVPGEARLTGRGVSYCATCDGNFMKGKPVAVIGGGNTALEDALFLSTLCPSVWLVHRRDTFRGESHLVESVQNTANLYPMMGYTVLAVEGEEAVTGLTVAGAGIRRTLPVSGVFVAIGMIPDNSAFSPPVALDERGYLLAGEDCRTNVPGIFAAGDARSKDLRQLVTAAADGAMAASQAGRYLRGAASRPSAC